LCKNYLVKHVIEGKMRRRGGGLKQLMEDFKETRRYWNWREEELARTLWRTLFGRGYGPVVRIYDDGDDDDDDNVRYNFDNYQMIFILSFFVAISTIYWQRLGLEVGLHLLTSALVGGEGTASRRGHFIFWDSALDSH
jgi:hypothetical protein